MLTFRLKTKKVKGRTRYSRRLDTDPQLKNMSYDRYYGKKLEPKTLIISTKRKSVICNKTNTFFLLQILNLYYDIYNYIQIKGRSFFITFIYIKHLI